MSTKSSIPSAAEQPTGSPILLSIVTPAYNEALNLPLLYGRLTKVLAQHQPSWEWIIVDDHSSDRTFEVVNELARGDQRVRGLRFARNLGSHTAITAGLHQARGDCAVVIAADLQDPPETLPRLLEEWQRGAQVVWAARGKRAGERTTAVGFSRLYYFLMRHMVKIREMPASGADFFLIDRRVLDAFRQFGESNVSILALISWMGFNQKTIIYDKQARGHGRSGWNLEKKLKLAVDSITSFSYLPIRLMTIAGFIVSLTGFIFAGYIIIHALTGYSIPGWSSLMVVFLMIGGFLMIMLGVLGEYLWRALDEGRRRPRYLIEASTDWRSDHPQ